jgi:hypothetical protein
MAVWRNQARVLFTVCGAAVLALVATGAIAWATTVRHADYDGPSKSSQCSLPNAQRQGGWACP